MSRQDSLKEKISFLKEEFKSFFYFFMVILTASSTVIYQALIGKIEFIISFIGIAGLFVSFLVLIKMKKIRDTIDKKIDELEKIE